MDVDVADVAGGRGSTSMRTRADLGGSLSAATSRGSNRPVKVSGCFGRLLAYDEFPASDLVTSCWLSERALYRWRLAMLLYISWATGMEMFSFFVHSKSFGWSLLSPLDYYMYFTHWAFSFIWIYLLLAMAASSSRLCASRSGDLDAAWSDGITIFQSYHAAATYSLFATSLILSQFVTLAYWSGAIYRITLGLRHDFGEHEVLFLCVNVHGLQSVIMLVEFFLLNRVRIESVHAFWAFTPMFVYIPVNLFYTLVREQAPYDTLFWKETSQTWKSVGFTSILLTIVFGTFLLLSKIRERYYASRAHGDDDPLDELACCDDAENIVVAPPSSE
ncbi:unnamed protein product (mitochondrion) [Plasmodiophora brassicae]|uniref:Uncharacterized protein n=1 Tax=Plasmodiophora brassicae TaxID=37360 RepID=A0A3P3YDM3_PLABS|nr:unnamed protein product [Plasmodiophora brassicae]